MELQLSEKVQTIFSSLEEKLGKGNVFIVGGFVRDALLGKESKDIDFTTPVSPEQVRSLFPDGQHFRKFGTVSFKIDDYDITIATFRKESDYKDHRHPQTVEFVSSLYEDYRRRDFTINALYVGSDHQIIDPSGKGLDDIRRKKIRIIGNATERLDEDPLRILRAYRFRYKEDFSFTISTFFAIRRKRKLISVLSQQKIKEEVDKCIPEKREELMKALHLTVL